MRYAPWECQSDQEGRCRTCGKPIGANVARDCRKLKDRKPTLPAASTVAWTPREIRRQIRQQRRNHAAAIVARLRASHKPGHRPLAQAELAAAELAAAGKLDGQTCSKSLWAIVRDILDPAKWRPEWGVCPVPIPPTHRLWPGQTPRVAIITPVFGLGGTERWMFDLIHGLHANKQAECEVIVVTGLKRIDQKALDHLGEAVPVHLAEIGQVERILLDGGFHMSASWGITQLPEVVGRFRPNAICVHGSDTEWSSTYPRASRKVAEYFVAVSHAALRPLEAAGVPPWQRRVIHNGVDAARVQPTAGAREIRLRLGLEASDFTAAFIGRFAPEKRVELLIDALQLLGEGWRGLLMGDGPMADEYRRRNPGRVLFVEHSYEIGNVLAVSDCFVGLSRNEGFWYGGAEAAVAGVPLVTTRVGFLQELADELKPPPWIEVPVDVTAQQLADALRQCRCDRPDTPRLAAAVGQWTVKRMADGWADLIREATAPPAPVVSVLMSVWDTPAAMLREAWESIDRQTVTDWEMVVVDDGSTDPGTVAELDRIGADPRVHLIRLLENGGLAAAHNVGLAACCSELVAVMDADDIALPDRLEKQLAYAQAHPEADVIGGQVEIFEGDKIHQVTSHPAVMDAAAVDAMIAAGRGVWILNHPAALCRRSKILAIGGYPTHLRKTQDLGLWLRAIRHGLTIHNQPDVVLRYRIHASQITGQREDHAAEVALTTREEWLKWKKTSTCHETDSTL